MMTPLRTKLRDVRTFVPFGAVRSVAAAVPDPGVGVLTGLGALVLAFWNLHVVALLILTAMAGGFDLLAGARKATLLEKEGLGAYSRDKLDEGAIQKAVLLIVSFFLGMTIDSLVTLFGGLIDLGFEEPFRTFTPFTAASLMYRLYKESGSIMRNVEETPGGRGELWPALSKLVDTLRYRLLNPAGSDELPNRRWGDDVTAEERRWLEDRLRERRGAGREAP